MSNPRQIGEGYYRKAMEYKESGDYIGALNEIRLAISNYPHDPAYQREREAIEGLLDPARLSDEMLEHVRSGDFARAVKCAEALSAQCPDRYTSLSELASGERGEGGRQAFPSTLVPSAEGYARERNYGLAMRLLAEAIALDPKDVALRDRIEEFARRHRARLSAEEAGRLYPGDIDGAIAAMGRAAELAPGEGEYREALGRMEGERPKIIYGEAKRLYGQGKLEEAERLVARGQEFDPGSQDFAALRVKIERAKAERGAEEERKEFKRSRSRSE